MHGECLYDALDAIYVSCIHKSNSTFYVLKFFYPRPVASLETQKVSLDSRLLSSSFSDILYVHPARTEVGGATVKGVIIALSFLSCPKYANSRTTNT